MTENNKLIHKITPVTEGIEIIQRYTPISERLTQLAEECAELAQAALKLRRALNPGGSPTPCDLTEANENMQEEVADVLVCIAAVDRYIFDVSPCLGVETVMRNKIKRWARRLGRKEEDIE